MSRPFKLEGCWTAMTSPFSADGRVLDLNRWEAQLTFQAQGGVRGVVPCGTTGEAPTLEVSEQRTLIAKAVDVAKPLDGVPGEDDDWQLSVTVGQVFTFGGNLGRSAR